MTEHEADVLVIGAGLVGIATAYYLVRLRPSLGVLLVDAAEPMSRTSAVSGENYRNWWPHPVMTDFTDHGIDLLETIARDSDDRIGMTRRGYALATRADDVDTLLDELAAGYGGDGEIRVHGRAGGTAYRPPIAAEWRSAPSGVDVLHHPTLIRETFPSFDRRVRTVVHVRRAGAIDSQQTGQYLLERYRQAGGRRLRGRVRAIERRGGFVVELDEPSARVRCERLVNAAGPWLGEVAAMLGTRLPVRNVLQQKIAFEDRARAIPRGMPFAIDLDAQHLDWTDEERALLAEDASLARYVAEMPGAVHCRPEGGDGGTWLKLGWAYNERPDEPAIEPGLDPAFPEIVLRGASRLNPALGVYVGRLPANARHYGGWYTMTEENWPLVGESDVAGAFVVGAMSGFGTMAACAGGEWCARHALGIGLPATAAALSPARYADARLMTELAGQSSRGVL